VTEEEVDEDEEEEEKEKEVKPAKIAFHRSMSAYLQYISYRFFSNS